MLQSTFDQQGRRFTFIGDAKVVEDFTSIAGAALQQRYPNATVATDVDEGEGVSVEPEEFEDDVESFIAAHFEKWVVEAWPV